MRFGCIICPVDFSDDSRAAFNASVTLALEGRSALVLVHVVEPQHEPRAEAGTAVSDVERRLHGEADRELQRWEKEANGLGVVPTDVVVRTGVAWTEIVALARSRAADLVVIGTHGRSGTRDALIGSVAERVVRSAPCTVLVVRPVPMVG